MQVFRLNAAGEVDALGWLHDGIAPIGYRLELRGSIRRRPGWSGRARLGIYTQEAGEYAYGLGGRRPVTVPGEDFFKWTLGVDYTFGPHLYVNAQRVHGMPDEFGAGDWFSGEGYVARRAELLRDSDGVP